MEINKLDEEEFINQVENIADCLSRGEVEKIFQLRKIVRSISTYDVSSQWISKKSVFLYYFLTKFVNDIWRHFGTDAPFDDTSDIVSQLSEKLGQTLIVLVSQIKEETNENTYKNLNSLIMLYMDKLVYVEEKLCKKY